MDREHDAWGHSHRCRVVAVAGIGYMVMAGHLSCKRGIMVIADSFILFGGLRLAP